MTSSRTHWSTSRARSAWRSTRNRRQASPPANNSKTRRKTSVNDREDEAYGAEGNASGTDRSRKRGGGAMVRQGTFKVTGMDLSGYMVKDGARAIAFYRDVLGLEPTREYPDNRGAEYEFPDGTTFGLWGANESVMPFQPSNGILFAVDDLGAAVAAVKARGIAVIMEHESPVCFMAMINDSEGNMVTLHKRKPQ